MEANRGRNDNGFGKVRVYECACGRTHVFSLYVAKPICHYLALDLTGTLYRIEDQLQISKDILAHGHVREPENL
jgi:hypothetical protein